MQLCSCLLVARILSPSPPPLPPNPPGLLPLPRRPSGSLLGKALYEGILVDVPLAPFFVARLQGRTPMFDDLASLDQGLHRSLVQVRGGKGRDGTWAVGQGQSEATGEGVPVWWACHGQTVDSWACCVFPN